MGFGFFLEIAFFFKNSLMKLVVRFHSHLSCTSNPFVRKRRASPIAGKTFYSYGLADVTPNLGGFHSN